MLPGPRSTFSSVHRRWTQCSRMHFTSTSRSDPFKILFFGRDEFSCAVLENLLESTDVWQDIEIVTQPDTKTGRRGSTLSISPLKILADTAKLRVHTIPHGRSAFRSWKVPASFGLSQDSATLPTAEHLLVTASFGRILPNSVLHLFLPTRRVNVHPSLLPLYRGAAPIQHALMDGRKETGVSVIEMTPAGKGIDSGSIWACEKMDIPPTADFPTLRDSLARRGGQVLVSVLRDMLAGKDTRTSQPIDPTSPRAPLITAEDSIVDFRIMTASRIINVHRAISHQKAVITALKTAKTLQLHDPSEFTGDHTDLESRLSSEGTATYHPVYESLIVRCAGDTYLQVPLVRQQDRGLLKAKEWWNGVKPEMRLFGGSEGPVSFVPFKMTQDCGSVRILI